MHSNATDDVADIDSVIRSRTTVRAFRSMAPSNFNSQPWRVHVLTGTVKRALSGAIARAHWANTHPPFSPFPQPPPPDCAARVDDFGQRYYAALGIDRADVAARARQTGRNFLFFGAPVGLMFTIDSALTKHSWLDLGLFIQNVKLAARARGLATCPQASFVRYQSIIAEQLKSSPEEAVACGMSVGYGDEQAVVNHLGIPREPLDAFTRWHGFGG